MGQTSSSSVECGSHINWVSGLAPAGACVVARVRHPRGLPRGAARMLARWVQHGSRRYPSSARVRDALTRHGSTLSCTDALDYTEFCVNTADWQWGLEFLLDLLAQPLLDAEVYENLQMQSDEEWRAPGLDLWVAQAWGWVSEGTVRNAAQLRGVWEHLYTFQYVQLSIGGAVPERAPAGLPGLIRRATRADPWPAEHATPWSPPPPPPEEGAGGARGPAPGAHVTLPVRHGHGSAHTLHILVSMPTHMTTRMQECLGLILEETFDAVCRECPSWARRIRCQWYAMGTAARILALACTVDDSVDVTAFVSRVLLLLRQAPPSLAAVTRACSALQKRRHVRCTCLAGALRQATEPMPHAKADAMMHHAVDEIYRTYLLAGAPPVTCMVVPRKNAAVCQRRGGGHGRRPAKSMGRPHALCPPSSNTSKTSGPPAVRA